MSNNSTHIIKLISSYTTKEISETEFIELENWVNQSTENKRLFSEYLKFYKKSRQIALTEAIDKDKAWTQILSKLQNPLVKIAKQKKPKTISFSKRWLTYAAAAVVIGILTTTYILKDDILDTQEKLPTIVDTIKPGTGKAKLTLDDGTEIALEKGTIYQTQNATSNGQEIVYASQPTTNNQQPTTNTLTIPRGGQFFIKLSDGTKVWLNSETQIKYPVSFTDGESRKVELIYGEAYFDVSHSTEHKGSPFKVMNNNQEVEVLGTEFNIKAYKEDNTIYTTLVTGKVAVNFATGKEILVPNQQSTFNLINRTIHVATVDVYNETSWKEGVFSFDDKSLKEIMKVLSRWYDVEVEFQNPAIKNEEFIGVLGKNQNLESILSSIKNFGVIKEFQIHNKKVILK